VVDHRGQIEIARIGDRPLRASFQKDPYDQIEFGRRIV
jgi:hypothetical protein